MEFRTAHRDQNDPAPVLATIALPPVALSREDLVAVLFDDQFVAEAEYADDAYVRRVIVDTVANGGLLRLEDARAQVTRADRRPGSDDHAWLQFCRRRVAEVFSLPAHRPGRMLSVRPAAS